MAGDPDITIEGNLAGDPELSFTPSGKAVVKFAVATNNRYQDRQSQEWKDGETSYWRCTAWEQLAENCAQSLAKGNAVMVSGRIAQKTWEKDGERKSSVEVTATNVAPSLKWATAQVTRNQRPAATTSASQAPAQSFPPPQAPRVSVPDDEAPF